MYKVIFLKYHYSCIGHFRPQQWRMHQNVMVKMHLMWFEIGHSQKCTLEHSQHAVHCFSAWNCRLTLIAINKINTGQTEANLYEHTKVQPLNGTIKRSSEMVTPLFFIYKKFILNHQWYLTCQWIGVPSSVPHLSVHWCTIRGTSLVSAFWYHQGHLLVSALVHHQCSHRSAWPGGAGGGTCPPLSHQVGGKK